QNQGNDGGNLSVELFFDSTGVVPNKSKETVPARLQNLYDSIYKVEGEIHQPMYCTVIYGDYGFHCKLQSINVEYLLFSPDGIPLRAKAALTFTGHIDSEANQKQNHLRSPDLSRILTVRQGDTLPIMCQKIYKSPFYYLQVAEINGLTNFRELAVGSQILFPPLEK
ncbi:MAG: peptidoglycan-binding protein, partial [Bacteroidota bacterium]